MKYSFLTVELFMIITTKLFVNKRAQFPLTVVEITGTYSFHVSLKISVGLE